MNTNDNSVDVLGPDDEDPRNNVFSKGDLETLNKIRNLRLRMIEKLAEGGKIPDEKADKSMLLTLLSDVDSEIMQRNRLKVAAKIEEANLNLNAAIAKALMQHRPGTANLPPTAPPSVLPAEFKLDNPVPGEMDIGVIPVSYEEIVGQKEE